LHKNRLDRLAHNIDALAAKDDVDLARAKEIACLRQQAALDLHAACAAFVTALNALLSKTQVVLDPPAYASDNFDDDGVNLFQVNARGRILQIDFKSTPELVSTEEFRVPYILAGSIRCFNQQLLQQDLILEHLLFYCLEKDRRFWRFFDERTYRSGPLNEDYLISLMEQLV
jgi:hypothetical protein